MKFYERVLQDKEMLNEFLKTLNLKLDERIQQPIFSEKYDGVYLFCVKNELSQTDFLKLEFLDKMGAGCFLNSPYSFFDDICTIFLNDYYFSIDYNFDMEKQNKTEEWKVFLTKKFGYKYINNIKKKVQSQQKKQERKNENIRTF